MSKGIFKYYLNNSDLNWICALCPLPLNDIEDSELVKGIRQYIFLLFHLEKLLKLYVNLFYRFGVTLLFLEIFEQKNHKSASFQPSWILADMHVTS
jgi:hypothetical protein